MTVSYNFVLFDTETNSTGKLVKLCKLAAVDRSGNKLLCYSLPNRDMDARAFKVNNPTIKTVNGICTLCKDNHPVTVLPFEEALTQLFLNESATEGSKCTTKKKFAQSEQDMITFDVPILLWNGGHKFVV